MRGLISAILVISFFSFTFWSGQISTTFPDAIIKPMDHGVGS